MKIGPLDNIVNIFMNNMLSTMSRGVHRGLKEVWINKWIAARFPQFEKMGKENLPGNNISTRGVNVCVDISVDKEFYLNAIMACVIKVLQYNSIGEILGWGVSLMNGFEKSFYFLCIRGVAF